MSENFEKPYHRLIVGKADGVDGNAIQSSSDVQISSAFMGPQTKQPKGASVLGSRRNGKVLCGPSGNVPDGLRNEDVAVCLRILIAWILTGFWGLGCYNFLRE